MDIVYRLLNAGTPIEGVLVMDEIKHVRLVEPPEPELPRLRPQKPKIDWGFVFTTTGKILAGALAVIPALVIGAVILAGVVAVGLAGLILWSITTGCLTDPHLVVVTADTHEWIQVYQWKEK
jgi:hypothetical protein